MCSEIKLQKCRGGQEQPTEKLNDLLRGNSKRQGRRKEPQRIKYCHAAIPKQANSHLQLSRIASHDCYRSTLPSAFSKTSNQPRKVGCILHRLTLIGPFSCCKILGSVKPGTPLYYLGKGISKCIILTLSVYQIMQLWISPLSSQHNHLINLGIEREEETDHQLAKH